MKEEFVPYDIALAMKELGFDKKCMMHWFKGKLSYYKMGDFAPSHTPAPLYQQAFRWFREKHGLYTEILLDQTSQPKFCFEIYKYRHFGNYEKIEITDWHLYRTTEEAQEACLRKLIEIVEENL